MIYDWSTFGFKIPEILLPQKGIDYKKWAVIACDQYTSEPEYWDNVKKEVGNSPSTFNLMLPEIYLGAFDESDRIKKINDTMKNYINNGTLVKMPRGCILVEREFKGYKRLGLMICTDLENYDFHDYSQTLTRATERTVIERIPPRLRIREGAVIEMPHIVILIDDPDKTVIEPLVDIDGEIVYDTDLMLKGGHVKGTFLKEDQLDGMKYSLSKLYDKAVKKYGNGRVMFQAMGDGNHSLATAKTNWENIKKTLNKEEIKTHPARFALCEIENIYDDSIVFEAIHRVIFAKDGRSAMCLVNELVEILKKQNGNVKLENWNAKCNKSENFSIPVITKEYRGVIIIDKPKNSLVVAALQDAIDVLIKDKKEIKLDYVHGEDSVYKLSEKEGNIGFLLPSMSKFELFQAVAKDGALPRKTFSIGNANEKRYYIESRYIG